MKQEFVTLYGRAVIEGDTLFFRSPYLPFTKTPFAQIGYELVFVLAFVMQFYREPGARRNMGIVVFGFLLLTHLPALYQKLVKDSYATRIPLSRIISVEAADDHHGLQTAVTLHLKNGRHKKVTFRKLEGQMGAFIQAVSTHGLVPA